MGSVGFSHELNQIWSGSF